MRKANFFPRLALVNLFRNGRFYLPYLLSCGGTAAMYYIIRFLCHSEDLQTVRGAAYLQPLMGVGSFIAALFAAVILLYANSFVMKRRQRELGLYNILGLEKRHIACVCLWEALLSAAAVILGGIAAGIALSRLIQALLVRMVHIPAQFHFSVSGAAMAETALLFAVLFALTLLSNLFRLGRSKPVELLHSAEAGEREPRTKWILVLLGLLTLGGGYFLALTVKDPVEALVWFFAAVFLVMLGTYCLFTAGSIALLKALRANRGFYYKTRHFTAVSGLLYRMKQNAVGLANICILSTMVLVTVSTTISLYIGLENSLNRMFPYDIEFVQDLDRQPGDSMDYLAQVSAAGQDAGGFADLRYYSRFWSYCGLKDGALALNADESCTRLLVEAVPAEDYTRVTGHPAELSPGEVLVYTENLPEFPDSFSLSARLGEPGLSLRVRGVAPEPVRRASTTLITSDEPRLFLVVSDRETAEAFAALDRERSARQFRIQMNLEGGEAEKLAWTEAVVGRLSQGEDGIGYTSKQDNAVDFYAMYGGFLFLGIFLGLLFLMATVLIIYYKQISEGYEDQRRYRICRQVGMTEREVHSSIHSQILLVFFLPLLAAGLHILMAFPMLSKMLELFQLRDIPLFARCSVGTLLVFCAVYAVVFLLTARTYGRIVGSPEVR